MGDFSGDPVIKTLSSNARGAGSIPGRRVKIPLPHASGPKTQNIKQKQYCNKFKKVFSKKKSGKWDGRKFCDVHVVGKNIAQKGKNLSVEK